ncbi:MAG: cytochrome c [Gemmatimonadaceae bacterium]|nr:cytochrome c [Gemmatimonadaceae bacterium]
MSALRACATGSAVASALLLALSACSDRAGDRWDWNRMRSQPRANAYGANALFPNGGAMRVTPAGAVSREAMLRGERPREIDLARGASRFQIFCAVCHGARGDGASIVGSNMDDPKPPSLLEGPARAVTPEQLFAIISGGMGAMPSYAAELSESDRWQVVSYVADLQRRSDAHTDTVGAVPLLSRP